MRSVNDGYRMAICVCLYTYICCGLRFEVLILSYVAKTIMGLIPSEFGQGITRATFDVHILFCYVNFNEGLEVETKILVQFKNTS